MLLFTFHAIVKPVTKPGVPDEKKKKQNCSHCKGPHGETGELSSCAAGDISMFRTLSMLSCPFLPAFHQCLAKWEAEKLSTPHSPEKFQTSTFSLLLQLLIFQGRSDCTNWRSNHVSPQRTSGACLQERLGAAMAGGSRAEHPLCRQPPNKSSRHTVLQALLYHPSQQANGSPPPAKPTLSTHSLCVEVRSSPLFFCWKMAKNPSVGALFFHE